jgi:hypothetical protein
MVYYQNGNNNECNRNRRHKQQPTRQLQQQ